MFMALESGIISITLSQNYDYNISRQLLNSFKSLTIISMFWSSEPLTLCLEVRRRLVKSKDTIKNDTNVNVLQFNVIAMYQQIYSFVFILFIPLSTVVHVHQGASWIQLPVRPVFSVL